MAVIQAGTKGRDFTAEELIGRQIRIEGPVPRKKGLPTGHSIRLIADDEEIDNAFKVELLLEANEIVTAKISLYRLDKAEPDKPCPVEEVTLRDDIEVSFSAYASEML